jgi:hypothetical protein
MVARPPKTSRRNRLRSNCHRLGRLLRPHQKQLARYWPLRLQHPAHGYWRPVFGGYGGAAMALRPVVVGSARLADGRYFAGRLQLASLWATVHHGQQSGLSDGNHRGVRAPVCGPVSAPLADPVPTGGGLFGLRRAVPHLAGRGLAAVATGARGWVCGRQRAVLGTLRHRPSPFCPADARLALCGVACGGGGRGQCRAVAPVRATSHCMVCARLVVGGYRHGGGYFGSGNQCASAIVAAGPPHPRGAHRRIGAAVCGRGGLAGGRGHHHGRPHRRRHHPPRHGLVGVGGEAGSGR